THWPRCTGDGNFGALYGPTDPVKTKFTLDLVDSPVNEQENEGFAKLKALLDALDEKLLELVFNNQLVRSTRVIIMKLRAKQAAFVRTHTLASGMVTLTAGEHNKR
ncbi:MAG: hypothetical protein SGPRY_013207, partial [Prymnesium sp.]